jgi:hypothetical protein
VNTAVDGMRLLRSGAKVKYAGVSGPCIFNDSGDIVDTRARFEAIRNGKPVLLKITS